MNYFKLSILNIPITKVAQILINTGLVKTSPIIEAKKVYPSIFTTSVSSIRVSTSYSLILDNSVLKGLKYINT